MHSPDLQLLRLRHHAQAMRIREHLRLGACRSALHQKRPIHKAK